MNRTLTCHAVTGIGEIRPGDDLAGLLTQATDLRDGDVLVVTSKVVSKAEGRVVTGAREDAVAAETARVVARRGGTSIVRTPLGLVMAAAGVDASNTERGTLVLLPRDPDLSARRLREEIAARTGANVAVLVSDTFGRAWRAGQTDIAVGAAGIEVLDDHAGRDDGYGNRLAVTAPAVADEMTSVADLVTGKLSRSPAAVIRGLAALVLPLGEDGPGAAALVRPEENDMFGLGAREAVVQALVRTDGRGFGAPATPEELVDALALVSPSTSARVEAGRLVLTLAEPETDGLSRDRRAERVAAVAFAHGWTVMGPASGPDAGRTTGEITLLPATP